MDKTRICSFTDIPIAEEAKFHVSGCIPPGLVSAARLPFEVLLVWLTITSVENNSTAPSSSVLLIPFARNGHFFSAIQSEMLMQEGQKKVSLKLGCRDIRSGEWELPTKSGDREFFVNVIPRKVSETG